MVSCLWAACIACLCMVMFLISYSFDIPRTFVFPFIPSVELGHGTRSYLHWRSRVALCSFTALRGKIRWPGWYKTQFLLRNVWGEATRNEFRKATYCPAFEDGRNKGVQTLVCLSDPLSEYLPQALLRVGLGRNRQKQTPLCLFKQHWDTGCGFSSPE